MSAPRSIVGGGPSGAKAAETLREEGDDGRLALVGEEPTRPYERPPLSTDHLRGEAGLDTVSGGARPADPDLPLETLVPAGSLTDR